MLSTGGKRLLEKQAHEKVILVGKHIVSELGRRIALAESLATALVNLRERLQPDEAPNKKPVEHILDDEGTESFIAGGGDGRPPTNSILSSNVAVSSAVGTVKGL